MIIKFKRVAPVSMDAYASLVLGELALSINYFNGTSTALFIGDGSGNKALLNPPKYTKSAADNLFITDNNANIARLDANGLIASADLPEGDYIDLEFLPSFANFPASGISGVIYFAGDTGKEYLWITYDRGPSMTYGKYVEINEWADNIIDGGEV